MHGGLAGRIENTMDRAASALFGAAAGFAAYEWLSLSAPRWQATALAAAVTLVLSFLCNRVAGAIAVRNHIFSVPVFDVRELETLEPDELTLTEADQLVSGAEEPLVLDDILAEIGPDSRVVRLFDRQAMPTPGELKSRVDDHLRGGSAPAAPDASQALLDALAELRRALR